MEAIIHTNDLGEVVASKWDEPKSRKHRHRKTIGSSRTLTPPLLSGLTSPRKKKKAQQLGTGTGPVDVDAVGVDGDASGRGLGLLGAIRRRRQAAASLKHKRRTLPSHGHYSSNHVLINNDRVEKNRLPLLRRRDLDEVARAHARAMADSGRLFYSDPSELCSGGAVARGAPHPKRRVGECVARSANVREAHAFFRTEKHDRRILLDAEFKHMGTGTAWSADGKTLYVCYLFEG